MTENESRLFQLGVKKGRDDLLGELFKLLRLDEKIAEAIAHHERMFHDQD